MNNCVPKIKSLRERFPSKDIQVDGGIGLGESITCCAQAGSLFFCLLFSFHLFLHLRNQRKRFLMNVFVRLGSNVIVAGTSLFTAHDPTSVIAEMKLIIDTAKASWSIVPSTASL